MAYTREQRQANAAKAAALLEEVIEPSMPEPPAPLMPFIADTSPQLTVVAALPDPVAPPESLELSPEPDGNRLRTVEIPTASSPVGKLISIVTGIPRPI